MMAKTQDYGWEAEAPESSGYINDAILKVIGGTDAMTVLDVGCGNGPLAGALAAAGYQVTGVDGDAKGIEHARNTYPGIRFETALFEDAPPGVFDFVCSTEVVEHLYTPQELGRYCFDALRPGGLLAISTPYHGYLKNLALALANKWDSHHTPLWHGGHIKFWSRATLTKLLESEGFVPHGFVGAGRLPYLWKSMVLVMRRPD